MSMLCVFVAHQVMFIAITVCCALFVLCRYEMFLIINKFYKYINIITILINYKHKLYSFMCVDGRIHVISSV